MTRIKDFGMAEALAHNASVRGTKASASTLREQIAKRSKFGNTKVYYDRIEFDSLGERDRYVELRLLERAGAIRDLVVHPAFPLIVDGARIGTYKSDFRYLDMRTPRGFVVTPTDDPGREVVEDFKSPPTAKLRSFQRNLKHVEAQYGVIVKVIMK